jgi:hypothetical protein
MPLYLGDALDALFGQKDSERKREFKKTTDSLKALGWEFEKFEEADCTIYFKKGEWKLKLNTHCL